MDGDGVYVYIDGTWQTLYPKRYTTESTNKKTYFQNKYLYLCNLKILV